jgi:hypothetical protein
MVARCVRGADAPCVCGRPQAHVGGARADEAPTAASATGPTLAERPSEMPSEMPSEIPAETQDRPCAECLALPAPRGVLCVLQSGRDESARLALLPIWLWVLVIAIILIAGWALWMEVELRAIVAVLVALPVIVGFWAMVDVADRRLGRSSSGLAFGRERIVLRLDPRGTVEPLVNNGATLLQRRQPWTRAPASLLKRLWRRLWPTPWVIIVDRMGRLRSRMAPVDRERFDAELARLVEAAKGDARRGEPEAVPQSTIGATPGCRSCGGERFGIECRSEARDATRTIRLTFRPASRCAACGLDDPDPVLVGRASRASVPVALWMMVGFGALGVGMSLGITTLFMRDVLRGGSSWLSFAILAPILLAVVGTPSILMIRMASPWRHRDAGDQVWTVRNEWCEIEDGMRRRAVPWSSLEAIDGIIASGGTPDGRAGSTRGWPGIRLRRHDAPDERIVVPRAADRDAFLQALRARAVLHAPARALEA